MKRDEFYDYVTRDHQRLMSIAVFHAGARGPAEDLLNTAVMRFCERAAWVKCADEAAVRGYLGTTMRRVLIDQYARAARRPVHLAGDAGELEWCAPAAAPRETAAELRQVLRPAVAALPERWRQVVVQRLVLDRSIQETAAALDIPASSVASAMKRAIGRLQETVTV